MHCEKSDPYCIHGEPWASRHAFYHGHCGWAKPHNGAPRYPAPPPPTASEVLRCVGRCLVATSPATGGGAVVVIFSWASPVAGAIGTVVGEACVALICNQDRLENPNAY